MQLNTVQMSQFDPGSMRLIIDVEEKWTGDLWRGDFSAKYVEEITNKTGSYKKFAVFIKMLLSAVKQQATDTRENLTRNSEISLNLLTQQDLIEMKQKKGIASTASSAQKPTASKQEKRYLILTFDGEFEKVHYPLPLAYCEEPDI